MHLSLNFLKKAHLKQNNKALLSTLIWFKIYKIWSHFYGMALQRVWKGYESMREFTFKRMWVNETVGLKTYFNLVSSGRRMLSMGLLYILSMHFLCIFIFTEIKSSLFFFSLHISRMLSMRPWSPWLFFKVAHASTNESKMQAYTPLRPRKITCFLKDLLVHEVSPRALKWLEPLTLWLGLT